MLYLNLSDLHTLKSCYSDDKSQILKTEAVSPHLNLVPEEIICCMTSAGQTAQLLKLLPDKTQELVVPVF